MFATMFYHFIGAMAGVWATAVLFHTPKRYLPVSAVAGAFAWVLNLWLTTRGIDAIYSIMISAVFLSIICRYLAVFVEAPAMVFLMPGIFPLVPGDDIYYTSQYLVIHSWDLASAKAFETLTSAGAIAFGIMLGFLIPQFLFSGYRRR